MTRFSENDLVGVFGRAVFDRGLDYAEGGLVFSLRHEGNFLRGQVMGSQLYQTRFEMIPPFESRCSCPYDGPCKHAAALAIVWLRQEKMGDRGEQRPEAVRNDSVRDRLGRLSPHELLDLIVELVDSLPGVQATTLEYLLRRDLEEMGREPGVAREEAGAVRSILRSLLPGEPGSSDSDDGWEDDPEEDWEEDWGEEEDDWKRHLGIENEQDEELLALDGQIDALISAIESKGLPEGLPFQVLALVGCSVDLVEASDWLGSMTFRWSRQIERMLKHVAGLVTSPSCPDEITETALNDLIGCYMECSSRLGSLLRIGLVETAMTPEVGQRLLRLLAEHSLMASGPHLEHLYGLASEVQANCGAVRAALDSLKKTSASAEAWLGLAGKCQQAGDAEATVEGVGMAVSAAVSWNRADVRRRAARLLMTVGEKAGARTLLHENFRESPSLGAAIGLLDTAEFPEERRAVAEVLVSQVGKSGDPEMLIRLHLEAGKPRLALWILEAMKEYRPELQLAVAAGIAELDIDTAVALWTKAVSYLIAKKNRTAYAEAAKALVTMCRALGQAQQRARWQEYYWDLQDRYRSYRALREELEQAGL